MDQQTLGRSRYSDSTGGHHSRWALPITLALLMAFLAVTLLRAAPPAEAATITASAPTVQSPNPDSITFSIRATAPAGLEAAEIQYRVINPVGADVGGSGTATFGPGAENDLRFTLQTRLPSRYIPVGSRIAYHWELTDADGDRLVTPDEEFVFLDGRYEWRSVTSDRVTAYYYESEAVAQDVVTATGDALDLIGTLLRTEVTYPTRVLIWSSIEDGEAVLRPGQQGRTEFTRLGGERVTSDVLYLFDSDIDTARHEAAHIVTHNAGDGAFASVPSWLDEGTAVYAQTFLSPAYRGPLSTAIANDQTLSLRSVNTPPGDSSKTLLFYGQSAAVVTWMIDELGESAFADLYAAIREGALIDDALQSVYGFEQDGLYNRWRASVDLPPVAITEAVDRSVPVAEATRGPLSLPTAAPSGDAAGEAPAEATDAASDDATDSEAASSGADDGGDSASAVIVIAVAVLLAALLGGGAVMLMRRSPDAG